MMARELFDDVTTPSVKVGSRAWYTVPLSIAAHVIVTALVIAIPFMTGDLPIPQTVVASVVPVMASPPPPPPAPAPVATATPATTAAPVSTAAPREARAGIEPERGVVGIPGPGVEGGIGELAVGSGAGLVNIPDPPPPPPVAKQQPVRPGGIVKYPAKVHHVAPVYPRLAQDARVSGLVILEAIIATDGRVQEVKVLRSQPFLDQAAIDAVRQWRFTPTLLNGVPVPVILTVTVNFELQ
jgi:TonB family protein